VDGSDYHSWKRTQKANQSQRDLLGGGDVGCWGGAEVSSFEPFNTAARKASIFALMAFWAVSIACKV